MEGVGDPSLSLTLRRRKLTIKESDSGSGIRQRKRKNPSADRSSFAAQSFNIDISAPSSKRKRISVGGNVCLFIVSIVFSSYSYLYSNLSKKILKSISVNNFQVIYLYRFR